MSVHKSVYKTGYLTIQPLRAPTLSYTRQLENRVAELEDTLSRVATCEQCMRHSFDSGNSSSFRTGSPSSTIGSSSPSRKLVESESERRDFAKDSEGLNTEYDDRASYHTNFFHQIPRRITQQPPMNTHRNAQVSTVWRERPFEQTVALSVRGNQQNCSNPSELDFIIHTSLSGTI